jgi:hypothetical protein
MNLIAKITCASLLSAGLCGCEVDSVSYSSGGYYGTPAPYYGGGYRPGYRQRWWCDRCDRYHDAGDYCRKRERVLIGFDRWGGPVWSNRRDHDHDDDHHDHKKKHRHDDDDRWSPPRPPLPPLPPPFFRP